MTMTTTSPPLPRSLDDYIVCLDDAVPAWFSHAVLAEYGDSGAWHRATIGRDQVEPTVRRCDAIALGRDATIGSSGARRAIANNAGRLAAGWAVAYQHATVDAGLSDHTTIGLIRYRVGDFFASHFDTSVSEHRVVAAIGILHSDFEGGELEFFDGARVEQVEPGQVWLFPATFQYPHAVRPVTAGVRHTILTWLR